MALNFFKKFFSSTAEENASSEQENNEANAPVAGSEESSGTTEAKPVEFVRYTVEQLVSMPDQVSVTTAQEEDQDGELTVIQIACEKDDMGRIIGKKGRTIAALRSLARDAAGRNGTRVKIKVLE